MEGSRSVKRLRCARCCVQRKAWWEQRAEAAIEQERARYHEMLRLIGAAKATSSTEDGSVSVTVNADGVATGIELTDGIRGKSPQLISADLMACIDQAQKAVREQVQHLMVTRYVRTQRKEELPVLAQQISRSRRVNPSSTKECDCAALESFNARGSRVDAWTDEAGVARSETSRH